MPQKLWQQVIFLLAIVPTIVTAVVSFIFVFLLGSFDLTTSLFIFSFCAYFGLIALLMIPDGGQGTVDAVLRERGVIQ